MLTGEFSGFPVRKKGSDVADKRSHPGYGAHQQVIGTPTLVVENKFAFGYLSHEQGIPNLQFLKIWREHAFRHQLKEELQLIFIRRRND